MKLKVLFGLLLFGTISGGIVYAHLSTKQSVKGISTNNLPSLQTQSLPTPTDIPTPATQQYVVTNNATNTIDCTGPDGKHLQITQQQCDDFNAAWNKTQQVPQQIQNTQNNFVACNINGVIYQLSPQQCANATSPGDPVPTFQPLQPLPIVTASPSTTSSSCAAAAYSNFQGDMASASNLGTCTVGGCDSSVINERQQAENAAMAKYQAVLQQCH